VHRTIRERGPVCDFSNGERTGIDDLAALTARVLRKFAPKQRAQGKPDARPHPRLVRKKAHEVVTTGSTGSIRLSPREWF
jgi:hypothetical protein